jgi:hypothetical protein
MFQALAGLLVITVLLFLALAGLGRMTLGD